MKTEELNTIENNKLIAEFMGYEKRTRSTLVFYSIPYLKGIHKGSYREYQDYDLQFDSSWDWLMPVVEKIEMMLPEDVHIGIEFHTCIIPVIAGDLEENFDIEVEADTKIEAIYRAVIEFIKWYNNTKS